jgi:hypothetical protein
MARICKRILAGLLAAGIAAGHVGLAAEIAVMGSCVGNVRPEGPLTGSTDKMYSVYESSQDQILLTVCNTSGGKSMWRVDVRRADEGWPRGLKLWVRRTGAGLGTGPIGGGRGYKEVGPTNRALCSGTGDRSSIPLQFKLTGPSLDLPAGVHVVSITYTVVEIGG